MGDFEPPGDRVGSNLQEGELSAELPVWYGGQVQRVYQRGAGADCDSVVVSAEGGHLCVFDSVVLDLWATHGETITPLGWKW